MDFMNRPRNIKLEGAASSANAIVHGFIFLLSTDAPLTMVPTMPEGAPNKNWK